MEKIQKFKNELYTIFGVGEVSFIHETETSSCVRFEDMICGFQLKRLILIAEQFELHYYVRPNGNVCEFVIYGEYEDCLRNN